jgi:hypothetical protein
LHEGQPSGAPHDRPSRAVRCAWCGRILIDGEWTGVRDLSGRALDVEAHSSQTHGICPDCFAELAPGVPYPRPRRAGERDAEPWD